MTSRRAAAWPVALLTVLVGLATTATPSRAQDGCDGVWVVVDAVDLGGDLTTRCAPGDPATGLEALRGAGHEYTFVPRQPGLVCTIDARPEPCNGAPEDAYWSYWHAPPGGDWTYATRGAGNRDPEPGTVEGWAFGPGDPPRRQPPAPATSPRTPAPDPSTEPPGADGTVAPTTPAAPRPTPGPADDGSGDERTPSPATTTGDAASPTPAATGTPTPAASATATIGAAPSPGGSPAPLAEAGEDTDGGSAAAVAGALLVVLLAAGASVQSRRRRGGRG